MTADHAPSPATDGLREAVEALALRLSSQYARLCTIAQGDWDSMDEGELVEADILNRTLTEVRAILAAHPAPPSEGATEANPLLAEVTWRDRHLEIGRQQLAAAGAEIERLHREVGAVAGIVRDDRVRAALHNALGDARQALRDIRDTPAPPVVGAREPVEETQPDAEPFVSGYCENGACDRCVQGPEMNLDGRMLAEECTHACHEETQP